MMGIDLSLRLFIILHLFICKPLHKMILFCVMLRHAASLFFIGLPALIHLWLLAVVCCEMSIGMHHFYDEIAVVSQLL